MKNYRSSIPKAARERIVANFAATRSKYIVEYRLNGKVVGTRYFHETGQLESECPQRKGLKHGVEYHSLSPGKLQSAEPYRNGLPHGTARQWSDEGKLIGTYTMKHGAGIDLWRQESFDGSPPHLSEARYLKDGKRHGFEWWLKEDQASVWRECHFLANQTHGIERQWSGQGLSRGYPKYWVKDVRVTKRQYLRACAKDPTLPPFRERDTRPQRTFPQEVAAALSPRR